MNLLKRRLSSIAFTLLIAGGVSQAANLAEAQGFSFLGASSAYAATTTTSQTQFALSASELDQAIGNRLQRVPELQFLSEWGLTHHCRVFGAGGTAAALAHYVRMDLERDWLKQNNLPAKYFESRFGYDYFDIYRSTQDADIVLDCQGGAELHEQLAQKLETAVQQKFPHTQGSKSIWEVRFLRYSRHTGQGAGQKDSLFSSDFQNQHTDSHSTGLIEFTEPQHGESHARDVKDWDNLCNPPFLQDVLEQKLHYYFSTKHSTTKRFIAGHNPPILSVVRYFTKAFQYGLTVRTEDRSQLRQIIEEFKQTNLQKLDPYVRKQINSNALKLFWHAQDVEFAANTLDAFGLRQILIQIGGTDEMGIWLNREPLRTKEIGTGIGKTAQELGITEVSHETNQFLAYENITRSLRGVPNVFISREGYVNETAACGDGFYTRIGHLGARGTGLTIRFTLQPKARQSLDGGKTGDFIICSDYVVVLNRAALTVIDESIELDPVSYFEFLRSQEFDSSDKGLWEKLERKVNAKLNSLDTVSLDKIAKIAREESRAKNPKSELLKKWFNLPFSTHFKYSDIMQSLATDNDFRKVREAIVHALCQPHWAQHPQSVEWLEKLIEQEPIGIAHILSQPHWASHPKGAELLNKLSINSEFIINSGWQIQFQIADQVLSQPHWASHPRGAELLGKAIEKWNTDWPITQYALKQPHWASHPKGAELLDKLITKGTADDKIAQHVLSQPHWASHPRGAELLDKLITKGKADAKIADFVLNQEHWVNHPRGAELLRKLIEKRSVDGTIQCVVFGTPHWSYHPQGVELLEKVIQQGFKSPMVDPWALSQPHWANHPRLLALCRGKPVTFDNIREGLQLEQAQKALEQKSDSCSDLFKAI